jgi:hypothetical protein
MSMTDVNKENVGADAQGSEPKVAALTEEQIHALQEELAVTKANLEKARKGETFNRTKRLELEKQLAEVPNVTEIQSKYEAVTQELEAIKTSAKNQLIDTVLKTELEKAGAKSVSTVLKLVDRSKIAVADGQVDTKSIDDLITELKTTDGVLFEVKAAPAIKQPGESKATDAFANEVKGAKTPAQLQAVMTKYGIKSSI